MFLDCFLALLMFARLPLSQVECIYILFQYIKWIFEEHHDITF